MSDRPDSLDARLAVVERVFADPPKVHYMSSEDVTRGEQTGVWSTDRSCYEFLARSCSQGSRTLETGSGVSTIVFAAWRTYHLCVTPGQEEADAIEAYCQAMQLPTDRLTFDIRSSERALPQLPETEWDIVLIDGGHGFPTPMIDWYYGAGRLRRGGILVLDDLQLPAVRVLVQFLEADERWSAVAGTAKWAAFERLHSGPLLEDWYMQPFYAGCPAPTKLARLERRVRSRLGVERRRLRTLVGGDPASGGEP